MPLLKRPQKMIKGALFAINPATLPITMPGATLDQFSLLAFQRDSHGEELQTSQMKLAHLGEQIWKLSVLYVLEEYATLLPWECRKYIKDICLSDFQVALFDPYVLLSKNSKAACKAHIGAGPVQAEAMRSTIGSLYKAYGWDVHDWLKLLVEPMVQFHGQFWTTAKGYGFQPRGPTDFAKSADKSFLSRLLFEHGWWDHNRPSQRKQSGAASFRAHISSGNANYGSVSMTIIPLGKRVVDKAKWNPASNADYVHQRYLSPRVQTRRIKLSIRRVNSTDGKVSWEVHVNGALVSQGIDWEGGRVSHHAVLRETIFETARR